MFPPPRVRDIMRELFLVCAVFSVPFAGVARPSLTRHRAVPQALSMTNPPLPLPSPQASEVPTLEDGSTDYSQDFFGKPAFLTVSGQVSVLVAPRPEM